MRLHSNASGRARRLGLALIMTAAAVTLAACSSSSSTPLGTGTQPTAPAATAPASNAPAAATAASGLSGKWSGQYSGGYQGTLTLHWHQSGPNLTGTIKLSAPPSTLSIHGTVHGSTIKFGTVGSAAITYSGSVSGNSMSGTYQVAGGGAGGGPWNATKA